MTPAVSVIIPAFAVTPYIAEAVDSVLNQTFKDFEIIVVNDGCPDTASLEDVLSTYAGRIVYIKKANGGLASARNAGIRAARAPLIALLDGDDAWTPDYLDVQVDILRCNPDVDVVYPNGFLIGDSPLAGRELRKLYPSVGEVTFESLVLEKCHVTISVTARKEVLLRFGGFDETLRRAEDFDMWLRISQSGGRFQYHRRPLLLYRRRADSLSADGVAMAEADVRVLDKIERTLSLSFREREAVTLARRRFQAEMAYHSSKQALDRGDAAAAARSLRQLRKLRWTPKLELKIALLQFAPRLALALASRAR